MSYDLDDRRNFDLADAYERGDLEQAKKIMEEIKEADKDEC